jgi:hypothetical protein
MRFKQFLESVQPGSLKSGDIVVAMDDIFIHNSNADGHIPSTYANTGQTMEFATEDKTRELVYFWIIYEDGDRSRYQWYADSSEFYPKVKTKRDADKDFLNSLKEEQFAKDDRFIMVKPMHVSRAAMTQGSKDSALRTLDRDVGQEFHRLGYDTKTAKSYFKYVDPTDGTDMFQLWWTWTADWSECCVPKEEYSRDWMKGLIDLDEAVNTGTLDIGQHVFVVKQITGEATDNAHETPFWWGDELEFMGFDSSGDVIATAHSEETDETFEYVFDEVDFKDSVVLPDEFQKLKRERDKRFLKGLFNGDDDVKEDFDFSKLRVGKKFKVKVAFAARETELKQGFHFDKGEELEFAGSKPWKNGKVVYFFGKKDEFNTHYMFEVPEQLFYRSVVPAEQYVKEDHAPEKVEVGQTRIILDPILGVRNGQLIPFDPGTKIKITGKVQRRSQSDPKDIYTVVTFTHEDHGDQDFDYLENEIAIRTLTPQEKKKRDLSFINNLFKEDEKFKVGDRVWFRKSVKGVSAHDGKQTLGMGADLETIFYGFEDGFALLSPRWRKQPTLKISVQDFRENAMTKRERDLDFMNSLKEDVGDVYVITIQHTTANLDGISVSAVDDGESAELYDGDVVKVIADDGEWLTIAIADSSLGAEVRDGEWNARHWHVSKRKFFKAATLKKKIDKEFFKGLLDKGE